ncbi:hypothetical protein [Oceanobacillus oncorhynchi]|uniref:hypothetical protein n=1 Tax=Oceanobacillus oncorhynchi TaxID=545501 RepID=UPI002F969854
MKQKILVAGLTVLLITAIIAVIHLANVNKVIREENTELQQENAELQLDKINLEIDLENITDAYWQLNNRLERMGAD